MAATGMSRETAAMRSSASAAASSNFGCRNRSPHVYAVMHNSGKTMTRTPRAAARRINPVMWSALKPQSATLTAGTAAATLKYPYRFISCGVNP